MQWRVELIMLKITMTIMIMLRFHKAVCGSSWGGREKEEKEEKIEKTLLVSSSS